MRWTRKLSLRRKITLVIMINTFVAMCVAGIAFAGYGVYHFKNQHIQDLNALANVMGTNSAAALAFKDPQSARDVLQALAGKPHILSACIYNADGKPFAVYHRGAPKQVYTPPPVENQSSRITSDRVLIFQKIMLDREKIGSVFLEGDTVEYHQMLEGDLLFFGLIIAVVSVGSYGAAARLQRPISNPILELAWTAKMVTSTRDYSIRAGKQSEDEVGVLIDGFNQMLEQIQNRDTELQHAREELEQRVEERTTELEQEVADRQRVQEALRESEGTIRLLLDSTAEAIYGIDREGLCTFCNPATLRLLGYRKPEDLLGRNMHQVLHHTRADGAPYPDQDCIISSSLCEGEGNHSDEEIFWRGDGSSFPVEYWAYPIRKEGKIFGAVVTFLDITERKRAEAALLEAKEAAEAASHAKSDFLANMSHEIRTPMNGIIGMTDLALDTAMTVEQRDYLGLVKSSADHLLHVINDILDFSKIEAGKLKLEETEFEIRNVLRDTIKALVVRADKKELKLAVRVSPDVPRIVIGDPTRLRQLIVNLVGNAIKFTEQGNIIVDADLEKLTSDGVYMHISVSDTGIGIPMEKQQVIFESFAQEDGSTTRRFGGTGLGLTISRQLAELMGGRMWVESQPGKGSTFHFTTVFKPGAAPASRNELMVGEALSGLGILLVSGPGPSRKILEEMLTNWHMRLVVSESGSEALKLMEAAQREGQKFPIVLLDAQAPGIDGFTLAGRIRENSGLAGSVILMLSVDPHVADAACCRAMGRDVFLTKPVGQSELLDAILATLGVSMVEDWLMDTPAPVLEKSTRPPLHILLAEDNAVNQKLAFRLLEKAGHHPVLAGNGKQALDALESADPRGFDLVLMDIQMPEMDGMEATAAIREREKFTGKHIPIIAMTAHAMMGDKERCLDGGMDGYIAKPIHPQVLFAEIGRCLAGADASMMMVSGSPESGEQLDRVSLLERVEGDSNLLAEIIHLFIDDAPRLLAAMRGALQLGDMPALERSAHSMKGAASNLSAQFTAAIASHLEASAKAGNALSAQTYLKKLEGAVQRLLPPLADLCQGVSK